VGVESERSEEAPGPPDDAGGVVDGEGEGRALVRPAERPVLIA
jgi:hypothetical protein